MSPVYQCVSISAHQCVSISAYQCVGISEYQCDQLVGEVSGDVGDSVEVGVDSGAEMT